MIHLVEQPIQQILQHNPNYFHLSNNQPKGINNYTEIKLYKIFVNNKLYKSSAS